MFTTVLNRVCEYVCARIRPLSHLGKKGWISLNGNSLFCMALKALAVYRGPYLKQVLEGVDSFIKPLFLPPYRYSANSYVRTGLFNPLRLAGLGDDSNTQRNPQEWIIILHSIVQAEGAF